MNVKLEIVVVWLVAGLVLHASSLLPEGFEAKSESSGARASLQGQKVLSSEGLALKEDVKVEYGEGHGDTIDEALKEAMKDVLQKVVGVYVDSDFRMNNDEIIKDEIITHSNGFIDHYKLLEETTSTDGRGKVITIKAWVKMRDFVNRMKKIAPSQTVQMDGAILDNDLSNKFNAEILLKKELENLNPAMDLMEVKLVDGIRPVALKTTDETVTIRYVFSMRYSKRYYNEFLPRLTRVLDQIAETTPRNKNIECNVLEAKLYPLIYDADCDVGIEKAVWKKCPVVGYCPRPVRFEKKTEGCLRAVVSFDKTRNMGVREWQLSEHLYPIYETLLKQATKRCSGLCCKLALLDGGGSELANGCHKLSDRWWLVGSRYGHYNSDKIDFAPFIGPWDSEDSALVKRKDRNSEGWDECWRYEEWLDSYVGCIDITIDRNDVAKIKTAKVTLETEQKGENE